MDNILKASKEVQIRINIQKIEDKIRKRDNISRLNEVAKKYKYLYS